MLIYLVVSGNDQATVHGISLRYGVYRSHPLKAVQALGQLLPFDSVSLD